MKLAKDVYLEDGRILLLAGFIIKPRYIRKLESFKIPFIYVHEDKVIPPADISEEKAYSEAFNTMKSVLTSVREGKELDVAAIKETVNDIVYRVINKVPENILLKPGRLTVEEFVIMMQHTILGQEINSNSSGYI